VCFVVFSKPFRLPTPPCPSFNRKAPLIPLYRNEVLLCVVVVWTLSRALTYSRVHPPVFCEGSRSVTRFHPWSKFAIVFQTATTRRHYLSPPPMFAGSLFTRDLTSADPVLLPPNTWSEKGRCRRDPLCFHLVPMRFRWLFSLSDGVWHKTSVGAVMTSPPFFAVFSLRTLFFSSPRLEEIPRWPHSVSRCRRVSLRSPCRALPP